ncbi:hypothetical protein DVA67_003405 [Solirubrobacter sp. CPCC 204708]|uniref:Uncharacterized protein n=1 Tax=Solirubrobacter deserti TaxID=2282478 RepID=A0ABT4RN25_9ACTN|nr:hypothetical protein [Solirubrobacter deserti]MBE2315006.1 hypothetical protein [Solirubrobacter deserti]MDA0139921.1 hypothetical protein [Solirubrobacter deserti]
MWSRLAAAFGGTALLGSLWLDWYTFGESTGWTHYAPDEEGGIHVLVGADTLSAWSLFGAVDMVLALIAGAALVAAVWPRVARVVWALGVVAVVLVGFRGVVPPLDWLTASTGAFVALAGAVMVFAGAWAARREVV